VSLTVGNYSFEGPFSSADSLEDRSGVYVVTSLHSDGKHYLVDVGESAAVKSRVSNHDRKPCWKSHANGGELHCCVRYTPALQQAGRREIEQNIRRQFDVPCGER
jgi:hypothetical protein